MLTLGQGMICSHAAPLWLEEGLPPAAQHIPWGRSTDSCVYFSPPQATSSPPPPRGPIPFLLLSSEKPYSQRAAEFPHSRAGHLEGQPAPCG